MQPTLSQDQIAAIASGYYDKIQAAIKLGFQDYLDFLSASNRQGIKTDFKARTCASLIHDYIRTRLREAFADDSNVKAEEFNGIFGLLISGCIFIRFKKLNSELKASNVKTEQSVMFTKQQLEFPGVGRITTLTAGYIPDATWTSILNIYLTCQVNDVVIWYKDLRQESKQPSIFELNNSSKVSSGDSESLVKLKTNKTDTSITGTDN
jgi:hypothetical protein